MKSQSIAVLLNGNNHLGFNYVELSSSIVNSGLPPNIKDGMIENIKEFLSPQSKAWYKFRGIPYRRGYLLYGPPGTGKSSICSAIAGRLWLDIYTISLNSRKLNDDMLNKFFQSLPKRCIVLFEDVDNAGIGQEASQMKNTDTFAHAQGVILSFSSIKPTISLSHNIAVVYSESELVCYWTFLLGN
ncbi:ATPase AAA-type core [Penicillium vulpinum]|nr:ATPase AAA-type core [Penicillium vulpinum]KAJ5971825.1 ATPase AAA-type core [Penicillium vulpinum]